MFTAVRSLLSSSVVWSLALVVAATAFATGCSGASDSSSESSAQGLTSADELCAAACGRIAGCGGSDDTTSCTESCQADSGATIGSLGTAAGTSAASCVDHASCNDVVGANFVNDCIDVALEETGAGTDAPGASGTKSTYNAVSAVPGSPVAQSPLRAD